MPSIVYLEERRLDTHSNALIKYSLINYFEFFFLNKYLLSKFLYEWNIPKHSLLKEFELIVPQLSVKEKNFKKKL